MTSADFAMASRLFRAAGRSWNSTSPEKLIASQTKLLRLFSPRLMDSGWLRELRTELASGEIINAVEISDPELRGRGHHLHNNNNNNNNNNTLVICHGFGSGLGFFFPNLEFFASRFDRVVAVDWLGMGGSSRPACRAAPRLRTKSIFSIPGASMCDSVFGPDDAVRFFTDSLAEFSETNGLSGDKGGFHLIGHSLGGYLTGMFTSQHPSLVKSLALASPAGTQ